MSYTTLTVDPRENPNTARAERAIRETMHAERDEFSGRFVVHSGSGETYHVDTHAGTCTCPDESDTCKHQHAVVIEFGPNALCDLCGHDLACFDHFRQ